jgi:hypothetical protein
MTLDDVKQLAKKIEMGRWAVSILEVYAVQVAFQTTGAIASFLPDTNTCNLNSSKPLPVVVSYFVHEMNHASAFHRNDTGDAKTMEKDQFVSKMVYEESYGTYLGFRAFLELELAGLTGGAAPPDRYNFFRSSYDYGKDLAAKNRKSPDEQHQSGLAFAWRSTQGMIQERFLGPNSMMSYAEYYSVAWSRERKSK